MTPRRRQRLALVALLVLGVGTAVALTLVALQENINLFFSPTEVSNGKHPPNATFRLGGLVESGSVKRSPGSLDVRFALTDTAAVVPVVYSGILPDLFREGQGIVALGKMDAGGTFEAEQVLAKHDENYMPPEVHEALQSAMKLKLEEQQ